MPGMATATLATVRHKEQGAPITNITDADLLPIASSEQHS